jgi:hypothetical protein
LLLSEPGVSGGCVADPVARAKGDHQKWLDTFTIPFRLRAQPAGRINLALMLRRAHAAVNRAHETDDCHDSYNGLDRLMLEKNHTVASTPWTRNRIRHRVIKKLQGIAMTVATGFSVLFVIAIPAAITALSLGLIGCSMARDSYRRHKNPA